MYRKVNSLGDLLVHSDIQWKPPIRHRNVGMQRCGTCDYCSYTVEGDRLVFPIGRTLRCKQRVKGDIMGLVYVIL